MADRREYPLGLSAWLAVVQGHAVVVDLLSTALEEEAGIPLSWFEVLLFLKDQEEGRMTMHDLAGSVQLSKSGVTRLVDRMVEAGLVDRAACATDRRVVYAAITPQGRSVMTDALPVHKRAVEQAFVAHLTPDEMRTLHDLMSRLIEGNGAGVPRCPSIPEAPEPRRRARA